MTNDNLFYAVIRLNKPDQQPVLCSMYRTKIDAVRKMNELAKSFVGHKVYVLESIEGACSQIVVDELI